MSDRSPVLLRGAMPAAMAPGSWYNNNFCTQLLSTYEVGPGFARGMPAAMAPGRANGLYVVVTYCSNRDALGGGLRGGMVAGRCLGA